MRSLVGSPGCGQTVSSDQKARLPRPVGLVELPNPVMHSPASILSPNPGATEEQPTLAMLNQPSFVIYAPRYRPNSGGAIATHKLCDLLNRAGYKSAVFPHWMPSWISSLAVTPRSIAYLASRLLRRLYTTNPEYRTPLATATDVADGVVIYPEIIGGNPLRAQKYARWLLHQPGFHGGRFRYQADDLYFCYQMAFNRHCDGMIFGGTLTVFAVLLDAYQQTNFGSRTRVAYMIRKGRDREDLPDLRQKWVLDGLDHQSLAQAFNECRVCYFYDSYTAYAAYAAACGCIPVIVPVAGVDKQAWVPEEGGRLGLAYGEDDIQHALDTRAALLASMRSMELHSEASVRQFVSVVSAHFGFEDDAVEL